MGGQHRRAAELLEEHVHAEYQGRSPLLVTDDGPGLGGDGKRLRQGNRRGEQAKQFVAMSAACASRHADRHFTLRTALLASGGDHVGPLVRRERQCGDGLALAEVNGDVEHLRAIWSNRLAIRDHQSAGSTSLVWVSLWAFSSTPISQMIGSPRAVLA